VPTRPGQRSKPQCLCARSPGAIPGGRRQPVSRSAGGSLLSSWCALPLLSRIDACIPGIESRSMFAWVPRHISSEISTALFSIPVISTGSLEHPIASLIGASSPSSAVCTEMMFMVLMLHRSKLMAHRNLCCLCPDQTKTKRDSDVCIHACR